jgi:hypothetical protein
VVISWDVPDNGSDVITTYEVKIGEETRNYENSEIC